MRIFLKTLALVIYILSWQPQCFAQDQVKNDKIKICNIRINIKNVFDQENLDSIQTLGNKIKFQTRRTFIKRELLFKKGEDLNSHLLEESARNLRNLGFLRDVKITHTIIDKCAEVKVEAQDTWTLYPNLFLESGGGANQALAGFEEGNFLGFGQRLQVIAGKDDGRKKIQGSFQDRHFFGTNQQTNLGHFSRSDGNYSTMQIYSPFRSLEQEFAWEAYVNNSSLVGRLFEDGDDRFIFRQKHQNIRFSYAQAQLPNNLQANRITLGYEFLNDQFLSATDSDFSDIDIDPTNVSRDPKFLANNRRFSGPFLVYQNIQADYISLSYIDRFERTQDFNLGYDLKAKSWFALDAFGSNFKNNNNSWLINSSLAKGFKFSQTSFIRSQFGASTRLTDSEIEDSRFWFDNKYFNVFDSQQSLGLNLGLHTFAGSLLIDYATDLDPDFEYSAGAISGLRGYNDHAFNGNNRLILNLEDRFQFVENLYRTVSLGMAVFVDIGGANNTNPYQILTKDLYSDIGAGLRFAFPRSAGGNVVRLDMALPLRRGDDGSDTLAPRFLLSTNQAFDAYFRDELEGSTFISTLNRK